MLLDGLFFQPGLFQALFHLRLNSGKQIFSFQIGTGGAIGKSSALTGANGMNCTTPAHSVTGHEDTCSVSFDFERILVFKKAFSGFPV